MKKNLKNLTVSILVLVLVCTMLLPVYAAENSTPDAPISTSAAAESVFHCELPGVVVAAFETLGLGELLTPEG